MVLEVEGQPHEAGGRGHDQQVADRALDDAVGEVEQALLVGGRRESTPESVQAVGVVVCRGGEVGDDGTGGRFVVHPSMSLR